MYLLTISRTCNIFRLQAEPSSDTCQVRVQAQSIYAQSIYCIFESLSLIKRMHVLEGIIGFPAVPFILAHKYTVKKYTFKAFP